MGDITKGNLLHQDLIGKKEDLLQNQIQEIGGIIQEGIETKSINTIKVEVYQKKKKEIVIEKQIKMKKNCHLNLEIFIKVK
jgi:hypothetical protein